MTKQAAFRYAFGAMRISILIVMLLFMPSLALAQSSVPADTFITLRRNSDAFASTPDYSVTINSEGAVVFNRIPNPSLNPSDPRVRPPVTIHSKIPVEKVALLVAEIEDMEFFSLKNRYAEKEDGCPGVWTDQGSGEISVTLNGKTKTIQHYYGCRWPSTLVLYPVELAALQDNIDQVVGTKRWLK